MITVKFYLVNPKTNGKPRKDEVSIYGWVTKSGTDRFKLTAKKIDEKIRPTDWDDKSQRAKPKADGAIDINQHLNTITQNLLTLYRNNRDKSFAEFERLALGVVTTDEKKTLRHMFDALIAQYEQEKDIKTIRRYKAIKNHIFGQVCKDGSPKGIFYEDIYGPIDFAGLDWNFYDNFRSMLYTKGNVDSSVNKYVGSLQTALRWARKRTYPVDSCFEEWPLTKRVNKPLTLDIHELTKLENAMLPAEQSIGRDFFCFEARTGQRISDIVRFDKSQYNPLTKSWTFNVKKGFNLKPKVQTVVFKGFCEKALLFLERHNYQWPKVPQYRINQWIRQAAESVGITQLVEVRTWKHNKCEITQERKCDLISTHVGRKSFATILIPILGLAEVMDMMGVDSQRTMQHYHGAHDQALRIIKLIEADSVLRSQVEETKLKAG